MRTMKTMTTMATGALSAILLLAAGCGGSGNSSVVHVLDSNDPVDIPAGSCVAVTPPAAIPGGALTSYNISDDNQDDMDIAVVDSSIGCDPTTADTAFTTGTGGGQGSGVIPVDSTYILAISCFNLVETCIPTVNSWTWSD
jgi:hypothetical protein